MYASRVVSAALVLGVVVGATVIACGGGSSKNPDAKVFHDSKTFLDGPAGAMGLGQKCGSGLPACPSNASDCIGATGTTQFCTPTCDMNATGTTGSNGQFPNTGAGAITPAPNDATCTGAFSGSAGTPFCAAIVMSTPAYTGQANTAFTGIKMDCIVACGTGSGTGPCPTGMACNTTFGACFPM
jgi:hypothetical protein